MREAFLREPLDTLSERFYNLHRSSGLKTAGLCARPAPTRGSGPQWPGRRRAHTSMENGDSSAEMRAGSWRPCASIDVTSGHRARLAALAVARSKVAEQWHGACSAAFVRGPLGPHFYRSNRIRNTTPDSYTLCAGYKPDIYWAKCRVFQITVRKAPFAARRGPSTAEAFKRVGYEVNGLFSFTSFAGESSASLVSLERSSTRSPTGSSRTGPLGAGFDAVGGRRCSMRARHAPGLALSVRRRLS